MKREQAIGFVPFFNVGKLKAQSRKLINFLSF